jgi:hypothetical protein
MRDIADPIIAAEDPQTARDCFIEAIGCHFHGVFHVFEIAANHCTGSRIHFACCTIFAIYSPKDSDWISVEQSAQICAAH